MNECQESDRKENIPTTQSYSMDSQNKNNPSSFQPSRFVPSKKTQEEKIKNMKSTL